MSPNAVPIVLGTAALGGVGLLAYQQAKAQDRPNVIEAPTVNPADSDYCRRVDPDGWSLGAFYCGAASTLATVTGPGGEAVEYAADSAAKGAGNAAFWGAIGLPLGIGLSAVGVGIVAVVADQLVLQGRFTGRLF